MDSLNSLALVLSIVTLVWCAVITAILAGQKKFFTQLSRGVTKKDLQSLLKQIVSSLNEAISRIQKTEDRLTALEFKNQGSFQKIGFNRFNPFNDTGGDQSFCVCLLDDRNNGIVITSLHSREATRIYGKRVEAANLKKEEYSSEEWTAYSDACRYRFNANAKPNSIKGKTHETE